MPTSIFTTGERAVFTLKITSDISVAELALLHQAGESVVRSAHVGNQYMSNMALLEAGIPAIWYDRTVGKLDKNYYPHQVIRGGTSRFIDDLCDQGLLIAKTNVAENHLAVLRQVIPSEHARVELYSDYLSRHQRAGREILPLLRQVGHVLAGKHWRWQRFVTAEGLVSDRTPRSWSQIEAEGVFGINQAEYGWIMPNIFNVIFGALLEAQEYKTTHVHHLSGPDMVKYVRQFTEDIQPLWIEMAAYVGVSLDFVFKLYPTASARFVTIGSRRGQLDALIATVEQLEQLERQKGEFMRSVKSGRVTYLQAANQRKGALLNELESAVRGCQEIFYDLSRARHLTHHDAAQWGLYVPQWTLEQPLSRLEVIYQKLFKIHSRVSGKN